MRYFIVCPAGVAVLVRWRRRFVVNLTGACEEVDG